MRRAAVVFIHGLFSSPATWDDLTRELGSAPDVADDFDFLYFTYSTRVTTWSPLRRMPDLDTIADSLRGFLGDEAASYERLVLVTHSQGGLVAQRYLSRMLMADRGRELARIRRLVMIACPNSGSDLFMLARRGFAPLTRNVQERELRPLQTSVLETQRRVVDRVVRASGVAHNKCSIPVVCYAGESDNVVVPASAAGFFPETGVLPGDHFSVIKPDGPGSRVVQALRRDLVQALSEDFPQSADAEFSAERVSVESGHGDLLTEPQLIPFRLRMGRGGDHVVKFVVHGCPVEQLGDVDVIVSSENVYLQMSQFFKPSTSGSLRWAAAEKSEGGQIREDVAGDHLTEWLRRHAAYGLPVPEGTVAPTPSGALAGRNVKRIYHAAIATPVSGTNSYHVSPQAVSKAVHNVFSLARRERQALGLDLRSICLPLFGSGRGRMSAARSFELVWEALAGELADDPTWTVHFTARRRSVVDLICGRLQAKKAESDQLVLRDDT
ncbi:alpha/beta fold hydrolase [Streptomyces achromogenes]|uniref:alpha/beta fold hydrolase n=1 Tax=Streptomyces achromogenes TaxID=67255 RepID=UPI0036B00373